MKKFKSGFTLAEVLITLAIIGIISAIILPSVMSNYQYKSVGVKLGKFISTVEGSARAFVVNEGSFSAEGEMIANFANDTFIYKQFENLSDVTEYPEVPARARAVADRTGMTSDQTYPVAILKDGTGVRLALDDTPYSGEGTENRLDIVPPEKYGVPVFRMDFNPNVQGLPSTAQKVYSLTVTELGYIFPHQDDDCAWELYNNDFNTTARSYADGTACHVDQQNP